MKNTIIAILVIGLLGIGIYYLATKSPEAVTPTDTTSGLNNDQATTTPNTGQAEGAEVVIGKSVDGKEIIAYNYGTGEKQLLFIGGIHGGYSWNTALVAFELMDYLRANPEAVPSQVKVTVIPVLNPDGLNKVVGSSSRFTVAAVPASQTTQISGRYNANKVDLNRNFDCDWQAVGKWKTTSVSGGSSVFSEPESMAIKNYVETHKLKAVVVWYSAAGGVYTSSCGGAILPETTSIMNIFAKASGYPAAKSFDSYETSGDLVNWLAKMQIPAISVLLTNHTNTEWTKNQAGVKALLLHYAQ
ncbi:MAG: M14 family zinc carboxypeptidase [bacterium]|nr:M14 family zinc carboxypeptidase [bacterium]